MFAIPIKVTTLIAGLGVAAWFRSRRPGVMTAERDKIYRAAVSGSLKDPKKIRLLADAFERANLMPQAHLLRQRAALRELPADVKKARREAWRRGMLSTNKDGIYRLADVMESEGCTNAAARLRAKADGLPEVLPADETCPPVETPMPVETPVEPQSSEPQSSEPSNAVPVETQTQAAAE